MQHRAPAPWVAASVALFGAGAVAATTAVAPLPAQPALHSHALQLTASWDDVLQTAEANATDIWNHFSAAPFAGLQQQLANQIGYIQGLADGSLSFADVTKDIQDHLTALFGAPATEDTAAVPGALFGPFLPEGGATDTLYQSLDDVVKATDGLLAGIIDHSTLFGMLTDSTVLPGIVESLGLDESAVPLVAAVLNFAGSPLSGVLIGQISTMLSPVLQVNEDLANISAALTGGDPDWDAALQHLTDMPANVVNAYLNGYGEVDLMPLLDQLGIALPALTLLDLPTYITELNLNLGGLLSSGGSIFDVIGMGAGTDALGEPMDLFSLPGVAVGPIASMVEFSQSIAMALGWDGSSDILGGLF